MKALHLKVAIITWVDSTMHGNCQFSIDEAKDYNISRGISAGFIVSEDDEQITIASDYFYDGSLGFRTASSYPKVSIKNIERQEVPIVKVEKEP